MKELYLNAEMELVDFSAMDVIVTSPVEDVTETTVEETPVTGENEGEFGSAWG